MMARDFDPNLWSHLPAEILERVLRWLPFSTLCRFRVVCKSWNTLPAVRPEEPYLLDMPCRSPDVNQLRLCSLYSPVTNIWSHIDLSFVTALISQLCCYPPSWTPQIAAYCSDGGLLCVWGTLLEPSTRILHYDFLVCNPLTKSGKVLPPFHCGHHQPIDLVMQRESSGGYKIFATTSETFTRALSYYMYDSVSNSWKMLPTLQLALKYHQAMPYCSIILKGVFYCYLRGDSFERLCNLYAYDIKQDSWFAYYITQDFGMPDRLISKQLSFVVSNGNLLLILTSESCFSITKIDLSETKTMVTSACCVPRPKDFSLIGGATFEYGNSIILASDFDKSRRTAGVDLLSLSADLKELKPITPLVNSPRVGRRWLFYRRNTKKANFDINAIP